MEIRKCDGRTNQLTDQFTWVGARDTCMSKNVNTNTWEGLVNCKSRFLRQIHLWYIRGFIGSAFHCKSSLKKVRLILGWFMLSRFFEHAGGRMSKRKPSASNHSFQGWFLLQLIFKFSFAVQQRKYHFEWECLCWRQLSLFFICSEAKDNKASLQKRRITRHHNKSKKINVTITGQSKLCKTLSKNFLSTYFSGLEENLTPILIWQRGQFDTKRVKRTNWHQPGDQE